MKSSDAEKVNKKDQLNTINKKIVLKEETINKAFDAHSKGNFSEAEKYYQLFIDKGFKDERVFSNYALILQSLDKLEEAESAARKAIEIHSDEF